MASYIIDCGVKHPEGSEQNIQFLVHHEDDLIYFKEELKQNLNLEITTCSVKRVNIDYPKNNKEAI